MTIETNSYLKPIVYEDLTLVLEWRNKESIRKNMYNEDLITLEQHYKWFDSIKENPNKKTYLFYLNDSPKGVVNYNIDLQNEKCEWGFYLGEDNLPKGTGSLMGYLAIENAFTQLQVRKITGEVFDFNKKSQTFHENLGFQREGVLQSHIKKSDGYRDIVLYALFTNQWQSEKNKIENFLKNCF
jgi:UDP-4-amino-4,6-dideoxy-N-acetyl-beta-L-altrosamine N-acetyltransferase